MERFPDFGEQAGDPGSTASPGKSDLPRPVAEWAEEMRAGFITPLPAEALRYQAALAAETARLATETVVTAEAKRLRWFRRGRSDVVFKRTAGRLAAQLGVAFVALVLVAGGAAAAAGVDVPGLLTRPFTSSEPPAVEGDEPAGPGTTVLTNCDTDADGLFDDECAAADPSSPSDDAEDADDLGEEAEDQAEDLADDDADEAEDAADEADDAADEVDEADDAADEAEDTADEADEADDLADDDADEADEADDAADEAEDAADEAEDAADEAEDAADEAEDAADDQADDAADDADDAADDAEDAGAQP